MESLEATGDVDLKSFLGELQSELVLSSPSQILGADVTLAQLFNAAAVFHRQ